jgi:hypothetical protein
MPYLGAKPTDVFADRDLNGQEFILDADADTSITADTDDQIDIRISGADDFQFTANTFTAASGSGIIQTDGINFIGDTANGSMTSGLTINQTTADNEILALKSSDIAHGMTSDTETDTYFFIKKSSATAGAPDVVGLGEGSQGIRILGQCVSANTAKSTSASAPIIFRGVKKSSASNTVMGSDENVVVIEGCTAGPGFIFDAEGSMHSNAANAVYDEYDDAQLVRTIDRSLSTRGLIASKFDEFVQYRHEDLAEAGLVGRDDDGSPNNYVNWMHLSKLHNGAIWQQHEKHENLLRAVYELASESLGKDKADKILEKNDIKLLVNASLLN